LKYIRCYAVFHRLVDSGAKHVVFGRLTALFRKINHTAYEKDFNRAREELKELIALAVKIPPLMYLDLHYESYRLEILTQDSSLEKLQQYLFLRGKQAENSLLPGYNRAELSKEEKNLLRDGYFLLHDMIRTLRFYACIGQDVFDIRSFGVDLIAEIDKLKVRDENSLILLLQKLIPYGYSEFENYNRRELLRAVKCSVEYVAASVPETKKSVTARRMVFERLLDFILADLFEGVAHGHYPRKCIVCGRHFLRLDKRNQKYCDGVDPADGKGRFCRQVAADTNRKQRAKSKDHPIKSICDKRISTINKYKLDGKYAPEVAETCKQLARNRRNRALSDRRYTLSQYELDMTMARIFEDVTNGVKL
jgi:hypothetical protein